MRGVIGCNDVNGTVGEASEDGVAVFARGKRRIHFEAGVVLHVFVDQREMMWGYFAGDLKSALFGEADLFERAFGGEMCDMQARAGEFGKLYIASDADRLGGRRHPAQTEAR